MSVFAVEYPYVVVEFLQLPYADIGDYVCIPSSWIRVRRKTDRKSIVAYPDEPPSITKMRIMNCDEPSEKWKLYMAVVKTERRSYEDAHQYIMEKIQDASRNRHLAVIRTGNEHVSATATKRYSPPLNIIDLTISESKKKRYKLKAVDNGRQSVTISNPSEYPEHSNVELRTLTSSKPTGSLSSENSVTKENCTEEHQDQASYDVRSNSDDLLLRYPYIQRKPEKEKGTHVNSTGAGSRSTETTSEPTIPSKITSPSYASIASINSTEHQHSIIDKSTEASCIEQNVFSGNRAENESSANRKVSVQANRSEQTMESSMEEGSPMVEAETSSNISSTPEVSDDEQSNSSELNSDEIITTSPNFNARANQSGCISLLNQVDVWVDQICDIFEDMRVHSSETSQIAKEMYESFVETQKVFEDLTNVTENLRALKNGKVNVVTSKEVTTEVQQIVEVNQAERKDGESPDVSMEEENNQNGDNEDPKTTHGHIRTFVLPPEYDPHDSRWTLKYRENDPKLNLVELVPRTNVFINSIKLAHCMRTARDSKELARKLLEEIFTQSALSVCSLTGVRANVFDKSGTKVRPGLDEDARMAILTFVEKHALKKKWNKFDSQSVINTIRSKIHDIRAKHAKTA